MTHFTFRVDRVEYLGSERIVYRVVVRQPDMGYETIYSNRYQTRNSAPVEILEALIAETAETHICSSYSLYAPERRVRLKLDSRAGLRPG